MTSTTSYQAGDLVLVSHYPFSSGQGTKFRPALVLLDTGDADILTARVTSQARQTAFDIVLTDWRGAGLILPSVVRLHKADTIAKVLVRRHVGHLQPADRQAVAAALRQTFTNW